MILSPSRQKADINATTGGHLPQVQWYRVARYASQSPAPLDSVPYLFLALRMARDDTPIRSMTLGNMRQNGVRGLFVTCLTCGYHSEVNVDEWPDDVPVPSFGPRMRCTKRGKLGATARPNWSERDYLPGGARQP
jgi:hypothetical protein